MSSKDWAEMIISLITLILLAIYTWKTHLMQEAVVKQVKAAAEQTKVAQAQLAAIVRQVRLSMLPAFVLQITGNDPKGNLEILNIGNGIAINISIDRLNLNPAYNFEDDSCPNIIFKREIFVATGGWRKIEHELYYGNKRVPSIGDPTPAPRDLVHELREENAGERVFPLRVRFQDIEGNKYTQLIKMGKGGCTPEPVQLDTA